MTPETPILGNDEPPRAGDFFHPLNARFLRGLRARAETQPVWNVMAWAVGALNLRIEIRRGRIPAEGPLLVIGNDPSPMAGFVILSLVRREDHFFIGAPGWTKQGRGVAERCLPVFTTAKFSENFKTAFRARFIYPRLYGVKPAGTGRRNIAALARAAEVLASGRALTMLPAGGTVAVADNWKHGVGHIMKQTGDAPASVVLVSLRGTKPRDAIRLLNPVWFRGTRRPLPVSVEISDPVPITEFRRPGWSARQMSLHLRDRYIETFGSL